MTQNAFLPPLQFEPILKEKIWGGSALQKKFGKHAPESSPLGESWEISGYGDDQTVCTTGSFSGKTLQELIDEYGASLIGTNIPADSFPLLYKLIDANDKLSVQVHPTDAQAQKNGWGKLGKSECWYILDAKPGAKIICGFNREVDADEVRKRTEQNSLHEILNFLDITPGDMLYMPAGTVHAILDGTVLYEVQESSDTTFRLYDWGRTDSEGKPRDLHLEESLAVLDVTSHTFHKIPPVEASKSESVRRIFRVACNYFALEEYQFNAQSHIQLPPKVSFQSILVLEKSIQLITNSIRQVFTYGDSILLPAACTNITVEGESGSRFLISSVPELQSEVIDVLRDNHIDDNLIMKLGGNPRTNVLMQYLNINA